MKRVLINAIAARQGGGKTYLLNLLKSFDPHQLEMTMIVHQNHRAFFEELENVKFISPKISESNLISRFFWENFYLPYLIAKEKFDILFAPSGILPKIYRPSSCKYVTVSQNMLPFSNQLLAELKSLSSKLKFRLIRFSQLQSFKKSDLVIFISNFAKNEIRKFGLPTETPSVTIPHGIPEAFKTSQHRILEGDFKDMYGEYFVYVSSFFPYKSQLEVLDSWIKFLETDHSSERKLLLVGDSTTPYAGLVKEKIQENKLEGRVILTGQIPYQKMPELYAQSEAIIFASQCENCPNILLESMASGKTIFCSDLEPMPEFAKDSVNYFNPLEPSELSQLLFKFQTDPTTLTSGEKASNEAQSYTWEKTQRETWRSILSLN